MNPSGTWGQLLARYREYQHVSSPALNEEILRTVRRPRLRRWLGGVVGQRRAIEIALEWIRRSDVVQPTAVPRVSRDIDDDHTFACALAGGADYIVSEDEDILAVGEYHGSRTVRAAEFLRILDRAKRSRRR